MMTKKPPTKPSKPAPILLGEPEELDPAPPASHPVLPYEDYEVYAQVLGTYKTTVQARTFHEAYYLAEKQDQWEIEGLEAGDIEQIVNLTTQEANDVAEDELEDGLWFALIDSRLPNAIPDVSLVQAIARVRIQVAGFMIPYPTWRFPIYDRKGFVRYWVSARDVHEAANGMRMCCVCGEAPTRNTDILCDDPACYPLACKLRPDVFTQTADEAEESPDA
jgi:hypothetical protein